MRSQGRLPLGLVVLLAVGALLFALIAALVAAGAGAVDEAVAGLPVMAAYGLAALVVARRHPANAVGWLLAAMVVGVGVSSLSTGYVEAREDPASLPLGVLAAWLSQWSYVVWISLGVLFLPLLFPTGRPPSPRWRPVLWLAFAALTLGALGEAVTPVLDVDGERGATIEIDNPLGLPAPVAEPLYLAGNALLLLAVPGAIGALVARLRRSRGRERQQVKWVVWTLGLGAAGIALAVIASTFEPADGAAEGAATAVYVVGAIGWFGTLTVIGLGLPAAIAVAIVRHRLYDIDVVINRTLVYAALTATLAGAYVASVLVLQLALSPLTEDSGLAIAGSTLAVAALFRPARTRIQHAVDRRFYRRKYDAEQTLETFAQRLRDQVELDAIAGELRGAVRSTVEPASVGVWLPGTGSRS